MRIVLYLMSLWGQMRIVCCRAYLMSLWGQMRMSVIPDVIMGSDEDSLLYLMSLWGQMRVVCCT